MTLDSIINIQSYCLGILISITIFSPNPSWEHFIWPLDMCVLADICNHTWITECGIENGTVIHKRLFIDECDMWEYNCDRNKKFIITNYSDCFGYSECPTQPNKFYRMGNYKVMLDGRKVIFDPTAIHTHSIIFRGTTRPMLPEHMFHGKRRYSKKSKRKYLSHSPKFTMKKFPITSRYTRVPLTSKLTTRGTVVLKNVTVIKNGKKMVKIVKGMVPRKTSKEDSDFLQ